MCKPEMPKLTHAHTFCRGVRWARGRHMSYVNGATFPTFKRTNSHTFRGRPTRKDGVVIYEHLFRNGSFLELKIARES